MNLSKGRIGEDNSALLGAMMITKIQLAAMSRVDVPEKERRDFYLYIDEFQNFSTDSFANILSEARKYRLNLILAHQYIEQLSEKVKPAVFGNVGTMVVFRVGAADAEELVKEFTPTFTEEDLVNLPKYEMYLKLMIDGIASSPFSAAGLPPLREDERTGNTQKVIEYSREKYASNRAVVEEKIMRWHVDGGELEELPEKKNNILTPAPSAPAVTHPQTVTPRPQAVAPRPQTVTAAPNSVKPTPVVRKTEAKSGYQAICASCGQTTSTIFKPDGIRPVYCRDCLSKKKEEKRLELEARHQAKEKERRDFSTDPAPVEKVSTLSLNDLNHIAPRDFRGREIKLKPVPTPSQPDAYREQDIKEGEEITIINNSF